jgi:hypothetical protein
MVKNNLTGWLLIIVLTLGLIPVQALAGGNNGDEKNPIRLYAVAASAPIGTVREAVVGRHSLSVNGQPVFGERTIWNGDLVQGYSEAKTLIDLDSIGQITLAKGTLVRLATNQQSSTEGPPRVLIASLISGEIAVHLREGACGFVQACGSTFNSTEGARFNLKIREGKASYEIKAGNLSTETNNRTRKYNIRALGSGDAVKVPFGQLSNIRVQITDENNKPMAEVPVMFSLAPSTVKGIGTLGLGTMAGTTYSTLTNNEGIAIVPFTAGRTKGTTSVSAVIEATGDTWTGQVEVDSYSHKSRNGWVVLAVAAAIGGGIAAYNLMRENDTIQVSPPTTK